MKLDDFKDSAKSAPKPIVEAYQSSMKVNFRLADEMGYSKHFLMAEALMEAELGSIRPGPILIKAKHDKNWVAYIDKNMKPRYMQVHDVRLARDAYHRWVVYGVDEQQMPTRIQYDLRPEREHSDNFEEVRELSFGEVIQLAKAGVIKGEGGAQISTLDGLMQIADESWRKLLLQKTREAAANGISLGEIEKQIFQQDKSATSAQRRT
jgi:hypothetical protein